MKKLQDIRESVNKEKDAEKNSFSKKIPFIIILKRKAIRQFPNNQTVGLYHAQAIDRFISIPFGKKAESVIAEEQIDEASGDYFRKLDKEARRLKRKEQRETGLASGKKIRPGMGKVAVTKWRNDKKDPQKAKALVEENELNELSREVMSRVAIKRKEQTVPLSDDDAKDPEKAAQRAIAAAKARKSLNYIGKKYGSIARAGVEAEAAQKAKNIQSDIEAKKRAEKDSSFGNIAKTTMQTAGAEQVPLALATAAIAKGIKGGIKLAKNPQSRAATQKIKDVGQGVKNVVGKIGRGIGNIFRENNQMNIRENFYKKVNEKRNVNELAFLAPLAMAVGRAVLPTIARSVAVNAASNLLSPKGEEPQEMDEGVGRVLTRLAIKTTGKKVGRNIVKTTKYIGKNIKSTSNKILNNVKKGLNSPTSEKSQEPEKQTPTSQQKPTSSDNESKPYDFNLNPKITSSSVNQSTGQGDPKNTIDNLVVHGTPTGKPTSPTQIQSAIQNQKKSNAQYNPLLYREETQNIINQIREIATKTDLTKDILMVNEEKVDINKYIAEKVISVFDSLNEENKLKFSAMLSENKQSFNKAVKFALGYK